MNAQMQKILAMRNKTMADHAAKVATQRAAYDAPEAVAARRRAVLLKHRGTFNAVARLLGQPESD